MADIYLCLTMTNYIPKSTVWTDHYATLHWIVAAFRLWRSWLLLIMQTVANLLFGNFLSKTAWKWKNLDPVGVGEVPVPRTSRGPASVEGASEQALFAFEFELAGW